MAGSNKRRGVEWTREEDMVLLEIYFSIKDPTNKRSGYMKKLKEQWDGKNIRERSQASLVNRVKTILNGNCYSRLELDAIERRVVERTLNESRLDDDREKDDGVDFVMFEEEEDVEIEGNELTNEVEDNVNEGEENVRILMNRLDTCVKDGQIRLVDDDERKILVQLREVFYSNKAIEIPSGKFVDKYKLKQETKLIDSLLHNLISTEANITSDERLILTGAFVVFTETRV